jgi:peptidoglycan/LPS O-acetylase OafA/YrhL
MLVFVYHAPLAQPFATQHGLGQAGVGFFFLLSGFILTYTYGGRLRSRADAARFYVARFARVYPAYAVSIALALPVVAAYGSLAWDKSSPALRAEALIAQVLAVQAWFPREEIYLGINSPAWSISAEAFFYALFPFVLGTISRSFAAAGARTIFVMAAATWACAAAVFAIPHHADVWTTFIFPPVRLVDFVVGMLLGLAFLRGYRLPGAATVWEIAAICAVAAAVLTIPLVPAGWQYSLWALPFWAALIAVFAHRRGAISRLLSHPLFVRLGQTSYAFYLVHLTVLIVAEHTMPPAFVTAVALAGSLAAAWILHRCVERPLRAAIRGRFAREAAAA